MPIKPETAGSSSQPVALLRLRRAAPVVARQMLVAFLFTFIAARVLVFLIMARTIPDLYLHVGGTHVHHLNYGIFLLAGVGAMLLFFSPIGRWLTALTLLYGVALALTFDEFGMWIHLGGGYWQRASFDAVVVIAAVLALVAVAPALPRFRPKNWVTAVLLAVAVMLFGVLLSRSFRHVSGEWGPRLDALEQAAPQ